MKEPNLDTVDTCCLNIDDQNRSMATLSMKINKRKKNILSRLLQDERGSPLVEEGMLLGLSLIVIGIIIGLVLQVLGWSGDALGSIYQQLDQIKEQLLRLLGEAFYRRTSTCSNVSAPAGIFTPLIRKRFEPGSAAIPICVREAAILDRTILPEHKSKGSRSSSKSFRSINT